MGARAPAPPPAPPTHQEPLPHKEKTIPILSASWIEVLSGPAAAPQNGAPSASWPAPSGWKPENPLCAAPSLRSSLCVVVPSNRGEKASKEGRRGSPLNVGRPPHRGFREAPERRGGWRAGGAARSASHVGICGRADHKAGDRRAHAVGLISRAGAGPPKVRQFAKTPLPCAHRLPAGRCRVAALAR